MSLRRIPFVLVALLTVAFAVPPDLLTAQQAPPAVQPPAADVAGAGVTDLGSAIQRYASMLDSMSEHQARLTSIEELRDRSGACTADPTSQSIGDALLWAVDALRQGEVDFARGKAALESCRLNTAGDALEGLTQQSEQVADMVKVFATLPADAAPTAALEPLLDQARWLAALRVQMPDLTDLARRLEVAKGAGGPDAGSFEATAVRVNRLLEIVRRADEALHRAVVCVVTPQPLPVVRRIVTLVQPIQQQARDLGTAIAASKSTPTACAAQASSVATKPPSGPSWLPPPASETTARKAPAALPTWVPDKDTPATQTATTRSADAVGVTRDRLISEEAQRIEEQAQKNADARAQRVADAQRAQETQIAQAAQVIQAQHEQTLAVAQQQVVQVQQQRAQRHTSFLGLLGRVTAAVGIMAATGGLAAPALAMILPAVGAVSAVAGGGAGILNAAAALPMPAGVAQAVAVARAAAGPAEGAPGTLGGLIPGVPAAPAPTVPSRAGATTRSAPASAPGDFFNGVWQCTSTTTTVDAAGRHQSSSNQAPISIMATGGAAGAGTYSISTQPGVNEMVGRLSGGQLVFDYSMPGNNGSCQLQLRLQPQASGLIGTTSLKCAQEQMTGTVQCHR